ncbi:MAG: hypothetical protein WCT28_00195 [Patescibacteria group bacterium]|jgi:hypothetical protein
MRRLLLSLIFSITLSACSKNCSDGIAETPIASSNPGDYEVALCVQGKALPEEATAYIVTTGESPAADRRDLLRLKEVSRLENTICALIPSHALEESLSESVRIGIAFPDPSASVLKGESISLLLRDEKGNVRGKEIGTVNQLAMSISSSVSLVPMREEMVPIYRRPEGSSAIIESSK